MIYTDLKLIHVHIPKTGGSNIRDVLLKGQKIIFGKLEGKNTIHLTALHYKNYLKNYSDYFSFAIIRHPYDYMISVFCYKRRNLQSYKGDISKEKFIKWIKKLDKKYRGKDEYKFSSWETIPRRDASQFSYVSNEKDEIIVNKILRLENYNSEVEELIKNKTNLNINKFTKYNETKRKDRNIDYYFDEDTKLIVQYFFKKDFNFFNYIK